MRRRRGMLVIMALLVLGIALVAGMGMMSSQVSSYRGVKAVEYTAQALALAQAGLEDARVKLEKDPDFPPDGAMSQLLYTYSEDMRINGERIGSYRVSIDHSTNIPAYQILRVTSTGLVGPLENPIAQRTLKAELDMDRDHAPTYFQFIRVEDMSGF